MSGTIILRDHTTTLDTDMLCFLNGKALVDPVRFVKNGQDPAMLRGGR